MQNQVGGVHSKWVWGDVLGWIKSTSLRIINLETSVTMFNYRMHPGNVSVLQVETMETLRRENIQFASVGMNAQNTKKIDLENQLEQEEEYIVNKLQKQLNELTQQKRLAEQRVEQQTAELEELTTKVNLREADLLRYTKSEQELLDRVKALNENNSELRQKVEAEHEKLQSVREAQVRLASDLEIGLEKAFNTRRQRSYSLPSGGQVPPIKPRPVSNLPNLNLAVLRQGGSGHDNPSASSSSSSSSSSSLYIVSPRTSSTTTMRIKDVNLSQLPQRGGDPSTLKSPSSRNKTSPSSTQQLSPPNPNTSIPSALPSPAITSAPVSLVSSTALLQSIGLSDNFLKKSWVKKRDNDNKGRLDRCLLVLYARGEICCCCEGEVQKIKLQELKKIKIKRHTKGQSSSTSATPTPTATLTLTTPTSTPTTTSTNTKPSSHKEGHHGHRYHTLTLIGYLPKENVVLCFEQRELLEEWVELLRAFAL